MLGRNAQPLTLVYLLWMFLLTACGKASIDARSSVGTPDPHPVTRDICAMTPEGPSCIDGDNGNIKDPSLPQITNIGLRALDPGSEITSIILSSTGAPATSCTVTPPLPLGLMLDVHEGGCRISGSPQVLHTPTEHTVTAVAAKGASDTATVTIAIEKSTTAPVLIPAVPQSYLSTMPVEPLILTNLGLDAVLCLANPALPNGLSVEIHAGSCRVVGTPTTATSGSYTITAKASNDSESHVSINLSVVAAQPPVLADAGAQSYEVGQAMSALTFTNTGATVKVNGCSIDPALPAGLSLSVHSNSCRISGTPTTLQASSSYMVTALGADGSGDTASISIAVVDTTNPVISNTTVTASSVSQTGMTLSWTKATDLGTLQADLEYKVCYNTSAPSADCSSGTVVHDFIKDINSAVLSNLSPNTLYYFQVVVKDGSNNLSSYATGSQQIPENPPALANAATVQSYEVGAAITALDFTNTGAPVIANGCSIDPVLPAGLSLSVHNDSCRISGTPTVLQIATSYTVTAESADGSTDSATVSIAVVDTTEPTLPSPAIITPSSITKTGFVLSWAAATDNHTMQAALQYKVCYGTSTITDSNCTGAVVAEDFATNLTTKTLSSLDSNTTYHFRVFVRDSALNVFPYTSGSQKTLADPPVIEDQGSKNLALGITITAFDFLDSDNPGAAIMSCNVNPGLPDGLLISNACEISGTPTSTQSATLYTVTATASDGSTDTATVTIAIAAANLPILQNAGSQTFVRTGLVSFSFLNSGEAVVNCISSPSLPTGILLDVNNGTCRITGAAVNIQDPIEYNITGTTADAVSADATITVTIVESNRPNLADVTLPVDLSLGGEMSPITFTNSGFAIVSCSISPDLPAGLVINSLTCEITGTPTATLAETTYTVTAVSADGGQDEATVIIGVYAPYAVMAGIANTSVLMPNGKLVVGGRFGTNHFVGRFNADGTLDTSLNGIGYVTTNFGSSSLVQRMAVQSDGKIVTVGGFNNKFAVVRLNENGSLDTSFSGTGMVITEFSGSTQTSSAIAIQDDGKIIAAGHISSDVGIFALARYNIDGTLDTSFNGTGKVTTVVGAGAGISEMAIQNDGKIVITGYSFDAPNWTSDFTVVRYNPDGTLDSSFNGNGIVIYDSGSMEDFPTAIAIQEDNKILVGGQCGFPATFPFCIIRLNENGLLDPTFGSSGVLTTKIFDFGDDYIRSLILRDDGKIVLVGQSANLDDGTSVFSLIRYTPGGILDTSFNDTGILTDNSFGGFYVSNGILLTPSNKVLVVGIEDSNIVVRRYNP